MRRWPGLAVAWGVYLLAVSAAANELSNPSFEVVGPAGSPTVNMTAAPGGAGDSAADSWGVFHNTAPTTSSTELLATTLPAPGAGARMIHVRTEFDGNGLAQMWAPFGTGPAQAMASAWIFLNNGVAGIGSGNGGLTSIDAIATTPGQWQLVQALNGQAPVNEMVIYSFGGGADFFVDLAEVKPIQGVHLTQEGRHPVEYSNWRLDERAVAGGGLHDGPDPGQTLYTEADDPPGAPFPFDGVDYFPGLEQGEEPDAQVDALANGMDALLTEVVRRAADLLISLETDPGPVPVAAYRERTDGTTEIEYTQRDLHADDGPDQLEDVDGLELWGRRDADYFSLFRDAASVAGLGPISVWTYISGTPTPYITKADVHAALVGLGFHGEASDVDVDGLMVQDIQAAGEWDLGDAVLLSIRGAGNFDGGEIIYWRFGDPAVFLDHGGHLWDSAFAVSSAFSTDIEEVDALEASPPDSDGDGHLDPFDNCPLVKNPSQDDHGGINSNVPDGIGDVCQCGDVTNNGIVNGQDGVFITRHGLGYVDVLFVDGGKCDVNANGLCNGQDGFFVTRAGLGFIDPPSLAPQGQNCHNANPAAPPCPTCSPCPFGTCS